MCSCGCGCGWRASCGAEALTRTVSADEEITYRLKIRLRSCLSGGLHWLGFGESERGSVRVVVDCKAWILTSHMFASAPRRRTYNHFRFRVGVRVLLGELYCEGPPFQGRQLPVHPA